MTKGESMKLLAMLRAAWPRQEVGADTAEVYAEMLKDIPFDEASAAVRRIVQTSKWFPAIAEIREQVAESRSALDPPELAWGQVQAAISKIGAYHQPLFSNPAIQRAVKALGWRQICLDENLSATRARFIDAYRAARSQQIESTTTGRLLASPYSNARPGGLEHGSYMFVGEPFDLPLALEEGDDAEPARALIEGVARHLRVVREGEEDAWEGEP